MFSLIHKKILHLNLILPANKYDVPPLVNRCSTFVIENVSAANAFEMLALARKHGYEAITKKCLEAASRYAEQAIKTQGFYGLDQSILCEFASQEELAIDEYTLFDAVFLF
jgi:hypothetical protein